MLREISKRCASQTITGRESIFPGVGLTSLYKHNPTKAQGKKIWWARVKIKGEVKYLDNYYTEMEAAHAYYQEMERLGLDINQETEAYKIYQNWLHVREFTARICKEILDDYNNRENIKKEWYLELIKNKLKY